MNNLQIFNYNDSEVRTVIIDEEPWFVAKDVCAYFGVTNQYRTLQKVEGEDKGVCPLQTTGGIQDLIIINEFGLYDLLFSIQPQKKASMTPEEYNEKVSNLKKFKRWVTHEVVPQIRKTGQYSLLDQVPKTLPEALRAYAEALEEKEKLKEQNLLMQPKADMYDVLLSAENSQTMTEVAKCFGIGRNKLFRLLRNEKILMTGGKKHNLPYQQYIDNDYFDVREVNVNRTDQNWNVTQTLVAAKGLDLIGRVLKKKGIIIETAC